VRVSDAPSVVPGDQVHPIYRRFTSSELPGFLRGLLWARQIPVPRYSSSFSSDVWSGWLNIHLDNGVWNPRMDILAVEELPDETFTWFIEDRFAVMGTSAAGSTHALLESCTIGFWDSTCRVAYFVRTSNQWSAPLVLGSGKFDYDGRAIAVGERDCSFATWIDSDKKYVGRWIGACSLPTSR
jgi:hypothetical protein